MLLHRNLFYLPFFLMTCSFLAEKVSAQKITSPFYRVKVEGGIISGSNNKAGTVKVFKGIPFAAPPVGDMRWKAPQIVKPWSGIRKCDTFGPSPMQGKPAPFSMWTQEFLIPEKPISEDCLYLNVWTGARMAREKRPVLVWIYGGGFLSGGSGVPIYDGEAMAKKGIVFVSINYRVGIFGFFAHPELTKESGNNASGNYGLMDQIAALKWVKKNIAAFGGDAENVTIAGQSAGSVSVNCLVASPQAKNLFTKAIAESGGSFTRENVPLSLAEEDGIKVAKSLNAASLKDLRNLSAQELMKANPAYRRPIIDGYILPQPIAEIFNQQKENKINLLTGWNQDEGLNGEMRDAAGFKAFAEKEYAKSAPEFLKYYPATSDSVATVSQTAYYREAHFGLQNYAWAMATPAQGSKVYLYRFTRKVPATGEYKKYGAFHTGKVPYAYDNLKFVNRPWEMADRKLAKMMSAYWANFAKTGNPNGKGLPEWKPFLPAQKQVMIFGKEAEVKPLPDAEQLDFLWRKMSKDK